MVVVDVVVTSKHGDPIQGLQKSDFTIIEDKKPQSVQVFEAHAPAAQPKAPPKIDLPPDQYTNFPLQPPNRAVNLVLFDMLNTPVTDQLYARQQMIQFLKTLPPDEKVALFVLGSRLRMIAGFTTESSQLVAAATKVMPDRSTMLDSPEDRMNAEDDIKKLEEMSYPGGMGGEASMFSKMRQFLADTEAYRTGTRELMTLEAFKVLAKAVAGYSGRKNLLWLSEGFPVSFAPDSSKPDERYTRDYFTLMRQTSEQLSSAQMAIYPIDIRGLAGMGVSANFNGRNAVGLQGGVSPYAALLHKQSQELQEAHYGMDDIAEQTGGKAFYNSNDLKFAMRRSMEQGNTYYTLAYVPENKNWDGRYRQIKVKVDRPGVQAQYRKGYFALPEPKDTPDESHKAMVMAMQPAMPVSTMLLLRVKVAPPDAHNQMVKIDYAVYAPDLTFTDAPDHRKRDKVDFVAVAWAKDGNAAASVTQTMDLALGPQNYQTVLRSGLPAHQELQLKDGSYTLRLGVMDHNSGKIGTVDIPLHIEPQATAAK